MKKGRKGMDLKYIGEKEEQRRLNRRIHKKALQWGVGALAPNKADLVHVHEHIN